MSKLIRNSEFVQAKLNAYLSKTDEDEPFMNSVKSALKEDYLTLEFLKRFKTAWNKSFDEKIYLNQILAKTDLFLPKYEPPARVIF